MNAKRIALIILGALLLLLGIACGDDDKCIVVCQPPQTGGQCQIICNN